MFPAKKQTIVEAKAASVGVGKELICRERSLEESIDL